jgi:phosphohistidine phosphatase
LEVLRPVLGAGATVRFDDDLYGADADELLGRVRAVSDHVESVMLVGHNPGLQDLAISLAGAGEPRAMELRRAKYPTAALATFDIGLTAWARLGPRDARLTSLVLPRELPLEPDEHPT